MRSRIALSLLLAPTLPVPCSAQPGAQPQRASYAAHIAAANYALESNNTGDARRWLASAPDALRGWEWRHLDAVSDESLATWPAGDTVSGLSLSLDGSTIAAALAGGTVLLLNTSSGEELRRWDAHPGAQMFIARYSPDGTKLVTTGTDKAARVWEAATGALVREFKGHEYTVSCAEFTPDGGRVFSSSYVLRSDPRRVEGQVHLWSVTDGEIERTLYGSAKPISAITLAPDGRTLIASTWDSTIQVWDTQGDPAPRILGAPPDPDSDFHLDAIAVSPDGSLIVAAADTNLLQVWNAADGTMITELKATEAQLAAAFSPDGRTLASGGRDDVLRLWSTSDWTLRATLCGHTAGIRAIAWTADSQRIFTGSLDKAVRVWDAARPDYGGLHMGFTTALYAAPFSPDGTKVAAAAYHGEVVVWDSRSGEQTGNWDVHGDSPSCSVAWSPDGARLASCSWDQSVRILDAATGKELQRLDDDAGIALLAWSPDGSRIATAKTNKTAGVWDLASGKLLFNCTGHERGVSSVAFSPDGALLATSGSDGTVRTWSAADGAAIAVMTGHRGPVESCAFTPDSAAVVSGGNDGSVRRWNARTGSPTRTLFEGDDPIYRIAVSPDGSRIAAGAASAMIIDARDGGLLLRWNPHGDTVWHTAWSPDGTRLSTTSWNGTIVIHDSQPPPPPASAPPLTPAP